VAVLVWRLIPNKIPTKDNLLKIGVLNEARFLCSNGCEAAEIVPHVFFDCPLSSSLW